MFTDSLGTLRMLRDKVGDISREGLKMSLLEDNSATLSVWEVSGNVIYL